MVSLGLEVWVVESGYKVLWLFLRQCSEFSLRLSVITLIWLFGGLPWIPPMTSALLCLKQLRPESSAVREEDIMDILS